MNWLFSVVLTVHVLVALGIVGLVLMQHGKGADMGAAFGGGASGSLFGASGSANFLSRTTGILAAIFFVTSLSLAYIASHKPKTTGSVMQETVKSQPAPVAPVPAGAAADKPAEAAKPVVPPASDSKAKDVPK